MEIMMMIQKDVIDKYNGFALLRSSRFMTIVQDKIMDKYHGHPNFSERNKILTMSGQILRELTAKAGLSMFKRERRTPGLVDWQCSCARAVTASLITLLHT
jgi:hypothetical protein